MQSNQIPAIPKLPPLGKLGQPGTAPFLCKETAPQLPHAVYYSLHFLISPAMLLSRPRDLQDDISRDPSFPLSPAWHSTLWGSQRETRGFAWRGAEQRTGSTRVSTRLSLLLRRGDCSIAAAQRPGGAQPRCLARWAFREGRPPPRKQVEGWGPSLHKVHVREPQGSLAPCCGVMNHTGCRVVVFL